MQKISKLQVIISILALLNVIFIPVFDVWGGLFPSSPDYNFFDVMEYLFTGENWTYNVFLFTMAIFIPTIIMLIFAILGLKRPAKISAIAGIICVVVRLICFAVEYGVDYLYDFDDGNISIGFWIGFCLFIVMALIKIRKTDNRSADTVSADDKK